MQGIDVSYWSYYINFMLHVIGVALGGANTSHEQRVILECGTVI